MEAHPDDPTAASRDIEDGAAAIRALPLVRLLSRLRAALLFFAAGSAVDVLSTWRCWITLKPREGHEGNFIVVAFVRHLGLPAGLVACKIAAALVVLASSIVLARTFPRQVDSRRLAETLLFAMGCIYLAAGFWNACGLVLAHQ